MMGSSRRRSTDPIKQIGLISDTHGLVRPQVLDALREVDFIVHGGDIGTPEVLKALKTVAPVVAIKGNNDAGGWAKPLPDTKLVSIGAVKVYVIHNLKELDFDPAARGFHVVISGHSHKPSVMTRDGVLFVNPGSAGPRRFKLPVAFAKLTVKGVNVKAKIIELNI